MPIKNDISDLPKQDASRGWRPDEEPWLAIALVKWWESTYKDPGLRKAVPEREWRASWSSYRCDRQLFYAMTDATQSNPTTVADSWRFWLGQLLHEYFQHAAETIFGQEWRVVRELKVDLAVIEIDGSLHGDLVMEHIETERKVAVEVKSINGFGFKSVACFFRGSPPAGPRTDHIVQGGMLAEAEHCDELVIVYLSLECMSPDLAAWTSTTDAGRFCAQWTIKRDVWAPLVDLERRRLERMRTARTWLAENPGSGRNVRRLMHDPELPIGAIVADPRPAKGKARWETYTPGGDVVQTGTTWRCEYCPWRERCIADGA